MKRRAPTPDELRLWAEVARTAAPLAERAPLHPPIKPPQKKAEPAAQPARSGPAAAPPRRTKEPALAPIDRRTVSRTARGALAIDARIDLHGMTQQTAHGVLLRFLRQAQADGARMVLVITGKGRLDVEGGGAGERGVLRRAVPLWLAAAEMRPFIVGFGEAAPPHGGTGALYVRLRRARG